MINTILKFTLPLLFILALLGCANQPELNTNLQEWEDCRTNAWEKCFGEDDEFVDIFNVLCSNHDVLNISQCKLLDDINTNCWIAQFELCDQQFDMDKIEAQINVGPNEI